MNKKKTFAYLLLSIATSMMVFAGVSFAWFFNTTADIVPNPTGEVITSYFHCGTGTEEDPYVITRPVHLYNLTRLYEDLDGFAEANNHFQLGYDLDNDGDLECYAYNDHGVYQESYSDKLNMNYYENFVPIGSEEKPFGGVFDGSDLTIDNLNISGNGLSDIGVFGYVTEDAIIQDLYIDNLDIDVTGAVADAHDAHDTNAYVGYIAGHIEDATCFTNTYVNNCEIEGSSVKTINDWGYFGKCDNAATLEDFVTHATGGQGVEPTWGGSVHAIDYTALGYTLGPKSSGSYTKEITGQGGYKMVITASTNANPVSNQVVYRLRDTSFLPLKFGSDDRAHIKNTGYLVGSNVGTGVNASPKISSYKMANIGNALSNTAYTNMQTTYSSATPNIPYDDSKLEVLTYYNNGWKRISDEHNSVNNTTNSQIRNYTKTNYADLNLVKYKDSRDSLQTILESSSFIHGIHFDNNQVSASNLLTIPANTARVDETNYSSTYQVPKGSINFKLREKGFINFFAGTYNSSQVALNFFSLHQVNRSGGNISSIKEITQIYENTGSGNPYVYKYSDNTYSAGTRGDLVFDVAAILKGNAPVVNMLYYFELPVNPGEYAMGVAGSTQGAYMIYLDLGAHGGDGPETIDVDDFGSVEYRSVPNTVNSNILLITYVQQENQTANLTVIYIEAQKRYNITYSGTLTQIIVIILSNEYIVYFNETQLPQEIQSNYLNL